MNPVYRIFSNPRALKRVVEGDWTALPLMLRVEPISACNHNCVWCSNSGYRREEGGVLDPEVFTGLLDDVRGTDVRSLVWIGSGEPTLHPKFKDMVSEAALSGFSQGLVTNGSTDISEVVPLFSWIRFSIDSGTDATHKSLHKPVRMLGSRSFDRGIRDALASRVSRDHTTIGVSYLLHNRNIGELEGMLRHLDCLGVDYIQLKLLVESGSWEAEGDEYSIMEEALSAVRTWEREDAPLTSNSLRVVLPGSYSVGNSGLPCWASSLNAVVAPSGSVFLCCQLCNTGRARDAYLGTLKETSFKRLWGSTRRLEVVRRFRNPDSTASCPPCWMTKYNEEIAKVIRDPIEYNNLDFL